MLRQRISRLLVLVFLFSGCAQCLLMKSEYFDITGKVFTPKPADSDMPILMANPTMEYEKIGTVRAWARYGTDPEVIKEELKRRARTAGADALMEVQIAEDEKADFVFCGKIFTTKRNVSGKASAVVYRKAAGESKEDKARHPALYNL